MSDNLPPLPYPKYGHLPDGKNDAAYAAFSEQQMQAYARAALAQAQSCVPADMSLAMFVSRLENMEANGTNWMTVQAVLALLSDCQYLESVEAPPQPQPVQPSEGGPDANECDPIRLWAEIHRLRSAVDGPSGYATWQDAATAERVRRVRVSKAGEALVSAYREKYMRSRGDIRLDAPLRQQFAEFNAALQTPAAPQPKD